MEPLPNSSKWICDAPHRKLLFSNAILWPSGNPHGACLQGRCGALCLRTHANSCDSVPVKSLRSLFYYLILVIHVAFQQNRSSGFTKCPKEKPLDRPTSTAWIPNFWRHYSSLTPGVVASVASKEASVEPRWKFTRVPLDAASGAITQ